MRQPELGVWNYGNWQPYKISPFPVSIVHDNWYFGLNLPENCFRIYNLDRFAMRWDDSHKRWLQHSHRTTLNERVNCMCANTQLRSCKLYTCKKWTLSSIYLKLITTIYSNQASPNSRRIIWFWVLAFGVSRCMCAPYGSWIFVSISRRDGNSTEWAMEANWENEFIFDIFYVHKGNAWIKGRSNRSIRIPVDSESST